MSLHNSPLTAGRLGRTLAAAGLLGLLSGCGFRPLYGADSAAHSPAAVAQMAAIEILPIQDRIGQEMRNLLIDDLHPRGPAEGYQYRLTVGIREFDLNLGLQENATSSRGQVKLTVDYSLVDAKTGKNLLHETLRTSTGYNILINQFGTVLSVEDARQRGLQAITDDLTTHLALYFAQSKT